MQLHNTDVSEAKYQIVDVWQKSNKNRNTVAYKYLIVQDNCKPSFSMSKINKAKEWYLGFRHHST